MPTVNDVLHHIAQDFNSFTWRNESSALKAPAAETRFSVSIAITTDVEESERIFLERFGFGRTFYFRLRDYEQGKQLAEDLYTVFNHTKPDMKLHTGEMFQPEDKLYLFIHLRFLDQE